MRRGANTFPSHNRLPIPSLFGRETMSFPGFPGLVQKISSDDGDVSFSSVYFRTLSRICGCSVPQMVVISSEAVTQCSSCSDDLEDGTVHCIHTSASFTFCIYMRTGLKDDVVYNFFDPEIGVLRDMIALITPDHVGMFREYYGGILKLVFRLTDSDRSAIHTLLQFYDPGLRCFVFPDYLLGPLMEDYASILEVTEGGLKEKGKFPGFHLSFLEAKAKEHAVVGNWRTVCALIAVSIYGIIMFPNQKNFVDINDVRLFMQRNPIPTLVGDVYYSVHNRNEKRRGGLIRCCAQLLYKWFMGYLPSRGAFVFLDPTVKWSFRLMGLRAKDIAWTHNGMAGRDFIYSCGSLPNVPLIGVQGCINYNLVLLRRQMGFAVEGPPLGREIQESFYFPIEGNQPRSLPPFDDWLRKRIELTHLPFPGGDPWCPLIEGPCSSVSMEEFLEMKKARDQLQAEKTELEMSVARIQMANQEIKGRMEDQDKRHAMEVIEDEKRRQILVRGQREDKVRTLIAEWEAKLKIKEAENVKIIAQRDHYIAERDHYIAERDHYFRQMKIHQKEIGRLQQENTELRCQFLTCLIVLGIIARARRVIPLHTTRPHRYFTRRNTPRLMDLPNAYFLELKEKMNESINIMQGFAVGQKALADKVEKLERASTANNGVNLEGVSNHGLGGSRDGGDLGKRTTVGVVTNNAGGFGAATSGRPSLMGNNLKDSLFPPFFGAEEDREEDREADQFSMLNEPFGQYGV
ncbi:hypothetical protein KIW84_074470 [Lathyrus oleraceus]|uniref:DUF7745 domain-containing protein n=1 Tax=Pisum sativum TaxID=3888 RepID=A0A9D5A0L0_PEA|nr:hypothetical protein KIW84_074470 [Pisum sativum]